MRKNHFIILLLLWASGIIAQNRKIESDLEFLNKNRHTENPINPNEKQTLYEIGEPITSFESNFKNLFRNVPVYVSTADFKLNSYELITSLESNNDIIKYKKIFLNSIRLVSTEDYKNKTDKNGEVVERKSKVNLYQHDTLKELLKTKALNKRLRESYANQINDGFQKGNLLYKINYTMGDFDNVIYVVCNPYTKKVILDNGFFRLKLLRNIP